MSSAVDEMLEAGRSYHDRPELSSSEVAAYLDDPIQWYHEYKVKDWARKEPTFEMKFGTNIHKMAEHTLPVMIKERGWDSFIKKIPATVLNTDGHCKGNTWKLWKDANPVEVYLKPGEQNPFVQIWEHLMANSWCRAIIEHGQKEVEHFWLDEDLGCDCRIKMDVAINNVLVDWKSSRCKNDRKFASDAFDRKYDVRLALYRRGFRDAYGVNPEIYIVAINTSGGYKVTPYRMPETWLDDAEAKLILTVDEMRHFNLSRYLDAAPVELEQPKYAVFNPESAE
jgi:hypothetical protein